MNECDIEYPPCECDEPAGILPAGMEMRPMEPGDLVEVKRLHEQCFPVRYDTAFYENVVRGFISRGQGGAKEPLYTQVAVDRDGWEGEHGSGERYATPPSEINADGPPTATVHSQGRLETGSGRRHSPHGDDDGGYEDAERDGLYGTGVLGRTAEEGGQAAAAAVAAAATPGLIWPPTSANEGDKGGVDGEGERRDGRIVGLITCQVMPLDRCRDQERLGLQAPYGGRGEAAHTEVVYILTLGTETSYRRQGVGRALLRRCVWLSRQEESIGAVYLHVITTNPPAHRFYESEGFVQVCCINDYYRIDGELYDCFLYALFVNGAQPPGEWGWGISSLSRRLRSIISFFRRTLGHVPEEGKLAAAVAAAGGSTSDQDPQQDPHQQQRQPQPQPQMRGLEEVERDEEQPPLPSPQETTALPFAAAAAAAGAAAAAARRLRGDSAGLNSGGGGGDGGSDIATAATAASGMATFAPPAGKGFALSGHGAQPSWGPEPAGKGAPEFNSTVAVDDELDAQESHRGIYVEPREGGARPATLTLWNAAAAGVGAWGRAGAAKPPMAVTRIRDTGGGGGGGGGGGASAVELVDGGRQHWENFGREPV